MTGPETIGAEAIEAQARGPQATGPQVYARAAKAARAGPGLRVRALRWLLPSRCVLCEAIQHEVVCPSCTETWLAPLARCPQCALPTTGTCRICAAAPPPFDAALTLGHYAAPQDKLVLALKFGGLLPLAHWLAAELAGRWQAGVRRQALALPDLIVPVPLAPARLSTRGFNQAWEIARHLARALDVRADATVLARSRDTVAQSTLDLAARHANMMGAFSLGAPVRLAGLHIGLVDDVMTTGATLADAAHVLKRHGARRVTVVTALRTP